MTQAKRHYLLASINQRLYAYYFLSRPPKTPTSNINKAGMAATTRIIKIIALPVITFRHSGSISCNARIDIVIFTIFCKYLFDEQYQSEKLFAGQENEKLLASRE